MRLREEILHQPPYKDLKRTLFRTSLGAAGGVDFSGKDTHKQNLDKHIGKSAKLQSYTVSKLSGIQLTQSR